MKSLPILALATLTAGAAVAEETRQLESHEHGVGQLDIAFDGDQIAMEFHAPAADIVGFEYMPESAEDKAAVEAAIEALEQPLALFGLPDAAGCSVTDAHAELEVEGAHDDHDGHDDHDDDEHAEDGHDDHDHDKHEDEEHEEHAEDGHDDHDHDDHKDDEHEEHAEDGHDDHDHDDHADEAGHSEFHAEYLLTCSNVAEATSIAFSYFEAFPNAQEVEVQVLTASGATAFEVERDAPALDLGDL